jgi:hypothetical protein
VRERFLAEAGGNPLALLELPPGVTPAGPVPARAQHRRQPARLLHHANVVVTDGDSYSMREARAKKGTTLKKS